MSEPEMTPWERFMDAIENPSEPTPELVALMESAPPWATKLQADIDEQLAAAEARGIAAGLERAAQWHDDKVMFLRLRAQELDAVHASRIANACLQDCREHISAAEAIRALPHDPIKADEGRGA